MNSITDKFTWIKITFAMFGKFCVTCSFGIIYVYSAEIYPTGNCYYLIDNFLTFVKLINSNIYY